MSNQPVTPTEPQAGQPAPSAPGTQGPAQGELSEADKLVVEKIFRGSQSRIDSYLNSRLKTAREALADPTTQQPAQAAPVMGGANQSPNAETQWAKNVEAVFGVSLDLSDPEASLLIEGQSPLEYKKAYLEAMRSKKARTGQAAAQGTQPPAPPTTPTTAGGQGRPVPPPGQLEKYKAEIAQPGLTKDQKLNIRDRFRKEGLDI
jgi:hypothetical protein